ncbi:MAG: ABC transporter permease [Microlunatus sp.]|nr:ABC transporter permease [Microlunatus sp.]MDN5770427.1 ABC transporter permease [Microlunatus sp.]MDN5803718.1 ABC transporter permease [Microlunatus sp.]
MIYVVRRLLASIITLFLASFFVFFAVQALPGDVAQQLLGQNATPEAVETLREKLGLNQGIWTRYFDWLGSAVRGDLGTSLVSGEPVSTTLWTAFTHTLLIAIPAMIIGIAISVLLGVWAAARRGRRADNTISVLSLITMSIPEFVVATVLIIVFAIAIPIFPAVVLQGPSASFSDLFPAMWLPIATLVFSMVAYIIRSTRSSTIDGLTTEYATTAELKGVKRRVVLLRHVLPTAMLPVLPVISINVAWLLGGVVVTETVFNYPGVGKLMIDSVSTRDLPVLQAIALLSACVYVLVNLAADLLALLLDPRQRTSGRASKRQRPDPALEAKTSEASG